MPINQSKNAAMARKFNSKSATLGQQSRSSVDLTNNHYQNKIDLRTLKTASSIKMNFESDDESLLTTTKPMGEDNLMATNETSGHLKSRRSINSLMNKKASEWTRLAKKFALPTRVSPRSPNHLAGKQFYAPHKSNPVDRDNGQFVLEEEDKSCEEDNQVKKKISRASIVSLSSSSSGCPDNDYFLSQSSMSSASSNEQGTSSSPSNPLASSQPASSSGINCSGSTSDEYGGADSRESSEKGTENLSDDAIAARRNSDDKSSSASQMALDYGAKGRPSRRLNCTEGGSKKALGVDESAKRKQTRAVSKSRHNNVKVFDGPAFDCVHYLGAGGDQLSTDYVCKDCHYGWKEAAARQEARVQTDDLISCDCCCDCFLDETAAETQNQDQVVEKQVAAIR